MTRVLYESIVTTLNGYFSSSYLLTRVIIFPCINKPVLGRGSSQQQPNLREDPWFLRELERESTQHREQQDRWTDSNFNIKPFWTCETRHLKESHYRSHTSGFRPLEQLNWLDLSINALTWRILDSLLNIKAMKHVSFRANRLCGLIPQGRPFNIFPAAAYLHNLCLCGKPLPPCRKTEKWTNTRFEVASPTLTLILIPYLFTHFLKKK